MDLKKFMRADTVLPWSCCQHTLMQWGLMAILNSQVMRTFSQREKLHRVHCFLLAFVLRALKLLAVLVWSKLAFLWV